MVRDVASSGSSDPTESPNRSMLFISQVMDASIGPKKKKLRMQLPDPNTKFLVLFPLWSLCFPLKTQPLS